MHPQLRKLWFTNSWDRFCDAKLNFVNSYLLGMHGAEIDTTLIQFSGEN
jgi:hypothetical protein